MSAFQDLVARGGSANETDAHKHAPQPGDENTTETTARKVIAQFGHPLSTQEKQYAGRALHYGFGLVMGAVYGAASEYLPVIGVGGGTAFGTLLFLGTDEAVLPLLKLAVKPTDAPPVEHLLHWGSHVTYGTTLELMRNQLVRLI